MEIYLAKLSKIMILTVNCFHKFSGGGYKIDGAIFSLFGALYEALSALVPCLVHLKQRRRFPENEILEGVSEDEMTEVNAPKYVKICPEIWKNRMVHNSSFGS